MKSKRARFTPNLLRAQASTQTLSESKVLNGPAKKLQSGEGTSLQQRSDERQQRSENSLMTDMQRFFLQSSFSVWFLYFTMIVETVGAVGLLVQ